MVTETKSMVPAAIPGGKIKRTRITVLSINKWVLGMGLRDGQAGTPLFAHELIHDLRALLALDIAAPVKLAMAAFRLHRLKLVVTAAAAHELAAVHALGGLVAQAALRAQRAGALVAHTVVRARVDVDQVLRGRGVEAAVDLDQLAPAVESHGGRAVILLLEGIAHLSEVRQLQPARLEATRARHSMALAGYVGQVVYCPTACFIVVQVHENTRTLIGALGMDSFPFPCIHELLGKAVAIVDVVPTAAPQPVPRQVLGACSAAAATGGQLALAACTAHGIHHPSCAHRVCEGCLSAADLHHPAKDRGVVHCAAVPSAVPKLVLTLFNACLRPLSDVLHVILIQVAELLLSLRKSRQLAAERLCANDVDLRHLNGVIHT